MHEFKYSVLVSSDDVETELLEQLVVGDIIIISTCMPRSLKRTREKTSSLRDISSVFLNMFIIEVLMKKGQYSVESDGKHTIGSGFIESLDSRYPTRILETLLQDRTTGRNIIWADNEYEALGEGYMGDDEITVEKITGLSSGVIKPRIAKEQEHQSKRTKSRAEVFTPSWLCNQMNNDIDAVWFNRRDVFNIEDNQSWRIVQEPIIFPKKRLWLAFLCRKSTFGDNLW